MMRCLLSLLIVALAISACRNPDVREDAVVEPPDTAVVDGPLYDTGEITPGEEPGQDVSAAEIEARRTILADPHVHEAHVVAAQDSVRITVVLLEEGLDEAQARAEQFVVAAYRHLERPSVTTPGPLGPSRFAYTISLRDTEGNTLFRGVKAKEDDEVEERSG